MWFVIVASFVLRRIFFFTVSDLVGLWWKKDTQLFCPKWEIIYKVLKCIVIGEK